MFRTTLLSLLLVILCACGDAPAPPAARTGEPAHPEATVIPAPVVSLSGKPLLPPKPIPNQEKLEADLAQARADFEANPDDPDALIWVARRLGYLWQYHEAIGVLDQGIARWPDNPRLYRHRGHRYITVRDFPRAQADLEKAVELIAGQPDEIEPDGAPNPSGIPRTTLAYNIWYHLGLSHFLQGRYEQALEAYDTLLETADNDDSIVAVTDWAWMSLMRLGREDAAAGLLERITPQMQILENNSYHRRLLMYKGLESAEALLNPETADMTDIATQGYGVANYYLVTGETEKANTVLEKIVAGDGWNAFGYIAAEADLQRL